MLNNTRGNNPPTLEARLKLAADIAQSIAAFHDVEWFHKDITPSGAKFLSRPPETIASIKNPYLIGFQHSRRQDDDFSEGPLQVRLHQRYRKPEYIDTELRRFKSFQREYDHYSLGVILVEIALWKLIDVVMDGHQKLDNQEFLEVLVREQLPELAFRVGSRYADVVRYCLTGPNSTHPSIETGVAKVAETSLSFNKNVVVPLSGLSSVYDAPPTVSLKRKELQPSSNEEPRKRARRQRGG